MQNYFVTCFFLIAVKGNGQKASLSLPFPYWEEIFALISSLKHMKPATLQTTWRI